MYWYTRRFAPREAATLAHKGEKNKTRMKLTERSTILGADWRLANANSSMFQDNNPDTAFIY